jgi:hypothetical protein
MCGGGEADRAGADDRDGEGLEVFHGSVPREGLHRQGSI